MILKRTLFFFSLWSLAIGLYADNALLRHKDVQHFIRYLVKHDGYNRSQLVAALNDAKFQPQIIEAMEKPYEQKTWDVYKALFLTPQRIQAGVAFWQENADTLARAEKEYGVPADVIVAILGVETQYGKRQGEYRVLDALTTLAFYYPKRSAYFTKELREYFLLCRERHVSPQHFIGSYAGAIGAPQFMPSNYRVFAVDYAGEGKRDLVNNSRDVIGSVANYFAKHGWSTHQHVAEPAEWHSSPNAPVATNSKTANYTYQRLMALGVKPLTPLKNPPHEVGLIELLTDSGAEYWMAYPNFYVITRYNTSPQYALAVHLLSQQLREARAKTVMTSSSTYG